MVGTRTRRRPWQRCVSLQLRISCMRSMICMVTGFVGATGRSPLFERMLLAGKFLRAHFLDEALYRSRHDFPEFRVAFNKLRSEIIEQPQHVVDYQDLTVTMHSCTDPDGWNRQSLGNLHGQICRHAFQHDGRSEEHTSELQSPDHL